MLLQGAFAEPLGTQGVPVWGVSDVPKRFKVRTNIEASVVNHCGFDLICASDVAPKTLFRSRQGDRRPVTAQHLLLIVPDGRHLLMVVLMRIGRGKVTLKL